MDTFRIVTQLFMAVFGSSVINLPTQAGLWTLLGVVGLSVTNLLILAGLWTFSGFKQGWLFLLASEKCP